jgi:alkanesulfonate monooxygenase SsuD/methylene tetrahydromethanopterin reductase-like flavin-dependent oxidoreductase (luciferase family)
VRVNPKPVGRAAIPIVLGGNSDAALRRVVAWGDGWYGFNLSGVEMVAERIGFLKRLCDESGRDASDLRLSVALSDPRLRDVDALADLGVDELVLVEGPPDDARNAGDWVAALADRWMSAVR